MAIIENTIMKQLRKFSFTSPQYTWRTFKSVSIGTMTSGMHFQSRGNDFYISYVKIEPVVLEIRLVAVT
jgi:hypothetical protein